MQDKEHYKLYTCSFYIVRIDKTTCHGNTQSKETYSFPRYSNYQHKLFVSALEDTQIILAGHSEFLSVFCRVLDLLNRGNSLPPPPPPQKKSRSHLNILAARRVTLSKSHSGSHKYHAAPCKRVAKATWRLRICAPLS